MGLAKEFSIEKMDGFRIGNAQNEEAGTGVTVVLFDKDKGARAGVDVSGGGPASRETPLASPLTADNPVNAIVLSGGSAYGLAASDGVMHWLEEHGFGFDTGYARVPLVCQSCIYDLGYKRADIRPDAAMGYAACEDALQHNKALSGSIGAGIGATVGKIYGMERSSKSGLGVCALEVGDLRVAAIVVVNALGDICNPENGEKLAGLKTEDGTGFADSREALYTISKRATLFNSNTTIGVVITNGEFTKGEMNKLAAMTRNAYARCIRPVGTMADGDTIYAASVGTVQADINTTGVLMAEAMEQAIMRAVTSVSDAPVFE